MTRLEVSLIDVLRAFPGGLNKLADAAGIPLHTLYRCAHAAHRKPPFRTLDAVANVLRNRPLLGTTYNVHDLVRLWNATKAAKDRAKAV